MFSKQVEHVQVYYLHNMNLHAFPRQQWQPYLVTIPLKDTVSSHTTRRLTYIYTHLRLHLHSYQWAISLTSIVTTKTQCLDLPNKSYCCIHTHIYTCSRTPFAHNHTWNTFSVVDSPSEWSHTHPRCLTEGVSDPNSEETSKAYKTVCKLVCITILPLPTTQCFLKQS